MALQTDPGQAHTKAFLPPSVFYALTTYPSSRQPTTQMTEPKDNAHTSPNMPAVPTLCLCFSPSFI